MAILPFINEHSPSVKGGLISPWVSIDPKYSYRYSVWVKRKTSMSRTVMAAEVVSEDGTSTLRELTGHVISNYNFLVVDHAAVAAEGWVMLVGYIHPDPEEVLEDGGVYEERRLREEIQDDEFVFTNSSVKQRIKIMHLPTPGVDDELQIWKPRIDLLDAYEDSMLELLGGGPDGLQGPNGAEGVAGIDGVSIVFKGSFSSPIMNPQNGWSYYNTTDRRSYVYQDDTWYQMTIDGVDGQDGEDGLSVTWQGELESPPANPQVNWTYKDTNNGIIYIYTGTAWEVMVLDGNDGTAGTDGSDGLSVYVTYNSNPITDEPATPTNAGTTLGWTTEATSEANWISQKVAATPVDGVWGSPILIAGADGADGYSVVLTNESHTLAADSSGGSIDYTNASTDVLVYRGATKLSAAPYMGGSGFPGTYSVLPNGNGASIQLQYTSEESARINILSVPVATDSGIIDLRIDIYDGEAALRMDKTMSWSKSKAGSDGAPGQDGQKGDDGQDGAVGNSTSIVEGFIYLTEPVVTGTPDDPSDVGVVYDWDTGTFSGLPTGWSQEFPEVKPATSGSLNNQFWRAPYQVKRVLNNLGNTVSNVTAFGVAGSYFSFQGVVRFQDLSGEGASTSIDGGVIKTGIIKSNNYVEKTDNNPGDFFTQTGTLLNLDTGDILSKNFFIAADGDISFKAGKIGDWILADGKLTSAATSGPFNDPNMVIDGTKGEILMRGLDSERGYSELRTEGLFVETEGADFRKPDSQMFNSWKGGISSILERYGGSENIPGGVGAGDLMAASYGKARNLGSNPKTRSRYFGGYFVRLMARGFFVKYKVNNSLNYEIEVSSTDEVVIINTLDGATIKMPVVGYGDRGRIIIIRSYGASTQVSGNGIRVDGGFDNYTMLGGQGAIFMYVGEFKPDYANEETTGDWVLISQFYRG